MGSESVNIIQGSDRLPEQTETPYLASNPSRIRVNLHRKRSTIIVSSKSENVPKNPNY